MGVAKWPTCLPAAFDGNGPGGAGRPPLDCGWRLLYPPAKDIKAAERPVLAAALQAEAASGEDSAPPKRPSPAKSAATSSTCAARRRRPRDLFEEAGMKTIENRIVRRNRPS